jgi:hypothetical protein
MALRWYDAVRDSLMMAAMLASICLSWPQLGRGLVLTTKIVVYYCLSPR